MIIINYYLKKIKQKCDFHFSHFLKDEDSYNTQPGGFNN